MTVMAACVVRLSDSISLSEREDLIEKLREKAYPMPGLDLRTVMVTWEAEDAWNLRGLVEEAIAEVEDAFDGYVAFPERDGVTEGSGSTDLGKFSWWVEV